MQTQKKTWTWPKVVALMIMLVASTLASQGVITPEYYEDFKITAKEIARMEILAFLEPQINPKIYMTTRPCNFQVWDVHDYAVLVNGTSNKIMNWMENDDGKVLNWALGNLTSGRTWMEKVVYIGNFTVTEQLTPDAYTDLEIIGELKAQDNLNTPMIARTGVASKNIWIHGGEIDGNRAGQSSDTRAINIQYVDNIRIYDLFIHDTYGEAVRIRSSTGGYLDYSANNTDSSFLILYDTTMVVGSVTGYYSTADPLLQLQMGTRDCSLSLIGKHGSQDGIVLSGTIDLPTTNNIIDVTIRNVDGIGLKIVDYAQDNTITAQVSDVGSYGARIYGDDNTLKGSHFDGYDATGDGVQFESGATGNQIIGGSIYNFTDSGQYAIKEVSGADYNTFLGVDVRGNNDTISLSGANTIAHDLMGAISEGTYYDTDGGYYIKGVNMTDAFLTGGAPSQGFGIPSWDYSVTYNVTDSKWYGYARDTSVVSSNVDEMIVLQAVLDDNTDPKIVFVDQLFDGDGDQLDIEYSGISLLTFGRTYTAGNTWTTPRISTINIDSSANNVLNTRLEGWNLRSVECDTAGGTYNIAQVTIEGSQIRPTETANQQGVRLMGSGYTMFVRLIDVKINDFMDTSGTTSKGAISIESTNPGNGQIYLTRCDYKVRDANTVLLGVPGRAIQTSIDTLSYVNLQDSSGSKVVHILDGGKLPDLSITNSMFEIHYAQDIFQIDDQTGGSDTWRAALVAIFSENKIAADNGETVTFIDNDVSTYTDWMDGYENQIYGRGNIIRQNTDDITLGTPNPDARFNVNIEIIPTYPIFPTDNDAIIYISPEKSEYIGVDRTGNLFDYNSNFGTVIDTVLDDLTSLCHISLGSGTFVTTTDIDIQGTGGSYGRHVTIEGMGAGITEIEFSGAVSLKPHRGVALNLYGITFDLGTSHGIYAYDDGTFGAYDECGIFLGIWDDLTFISGTAGNYAILLENPEWLRLGNIRIYCTAGVLPFKAVLTAGTQYKYGDIQFDGIFRAVSQSGNDIIIMHFQGYDNDMRLNLFGGNGKIWLKAIAGSNVTGIWLDYVENYNLGKIQVDGGCERLVYVDHSFAGIIDGGSYTSSMLSSGGTGFEITSNGYGTFVKDWVLFCSTSGEWADSGVTSATNYVKFDGIQLWTVTGTFTETIGANTQFERLHKRGGGTYPVRFPT